jgi:GxxExxY protein
LIFSRKEAQAAQELPMNENIFALCDQVREASLSLHCYLRHGHLEKVYENGLAHRLCLQSLIVSQQHPLQVKDQDGTVLGDYFADLFVEKVLLVELKACRALASEQTAQLLGYLRATRMEHGLLINFGSPRLEIRKFVLSEAI